jgi:hypothetical protein
MEFKPDKSLLMAYLYEEVECGLSDKIKAYLDANPEAMAEFEALKDTRSMMGMLEDEGLITPVVVPVVENSSIWNRGLSNYRVAAVILPLLLAGVALSLYLTGRPAEQTPLAEMEKHSVESSLSKEEVIRLIQSHLAVAQDSLVQVIHSLESKLALASKKQHTPKHPLPIGDLSELVSKEDMLTAFDLYRMESNQTFHALLAEERRQQELYTEQLISGLNRYYDSRREEDLGKIELALDNMLENQSIQRSKTDYLLGALLDRSAQKDQNGTQQNK